MKPFLLVITLALIAQAQAFDDWSNPFSKQLISAEKVHQAENKKALRAVKHWKRQQMLKAVQSANPYIFGESVVLPECRPVNAFILDCRK